MLIQKDRLVFFLDIFHIFFKITLITGSISESQTLLIKCNEIIKKLYEYLRMRRDADERRNARTKNAERKINK